MNKNRERMLLVAALLCVLALAGDRLLIRPLVSPWKERNRRISELQQQITNAELLSDRKEAIREQWQEMRSRSLPDSQSAAENEVLSAVGEWARTSRLNVTAMKPRWLEYDEDSADRLEVRVSASGDLAGITRFLYELESDSLAVHLEDVEIRARDDKGAELTLETRFTGLVLPGGEAS